MACHNRVEQTVRCVQALKSQRDVDVSVTLYLVDDGSSDGTAAAVRKILPQAQILQGSGDLYWSGGVRLAFEHAMRDGHDAYLWLNDDTHLDTDALHRLIETQSRLAAKLGAALIIVGSTRDPETGTFTYGGWRTRARMFGPRTWAKVPPDPDRPKPCDTANGNCLFITAAAVARVGNIDGVFRQGLGDLDYGLRALHAGCRLMIAPGYFGTCRQNDVAGSWTDSRFPLLSRWREMVGPKGLPVRAWWTFTRRHKGALWIFSWAAPYIVFWLGRRGPMPRTGD